VTLYTRPDDEKKRDRAEVATQLTNFEAAFHESEGLSQRGLAEHIGVPESTLRYWLKRRGSIDADPDVIAFFESPGGIAFVHRLVIAAHFVMTLLGPCGIRLVCCFLELTGLDAFIAASYGAQHKVSAAMEEAVGTYDHEERARLSAGMAPKQMSICEDETFHPETCLVAIAPTSNMILLEKYVPNRTAKTWTDAMQEALDGLPVEVIQATSDEGRGILHHVKTDLGAHHSPDVFHVQHELIKATSGVLASRQRQAAKALEDTIKEVEGHQQDTASARSGWQGPAHPPVHDPRTQAAQEREETARQALATAHQHQKRVRQAVRQISEVYHPYALETGAPRRTEELASLLEACFSEVETVASEAQLPRRCLQRLQKAKRVVVDMLATMAFFWLTVHAKVEALALAPEVETAVYEQLIPAIYLRLTAHKAKTAAQRHLCHQRADALLAPLLAQEGPFIGQDMEEKLVIERVAEDCAELFQRSSSCVEGRNGQLALRHHSLHRIRERKLAALTTVHNYVVTRKDGTTAAERFFGAKPRDLFEWLLTQIDLPGRPAKKRRKPRRIGYLVPVAA